MIRNFRSFGDHLIFQPEWFTWTIKLACNVHVRNLCSIKAILLMSVLSCNVKCAELLNCCSIDRINLELLSHKWFWNQILKMSTLIQMKTILWFPQLNIFDGLFSISRSLVTDRVTLGEESQVITEFCEVWTKSLENSVTDSPTKQMQHSKTCLFCFTQWTYISGGIFHSRLQLLDDLIFLLTHLHQFWYLLLIFLQILHKSQFSI